MVLVVGLVAHFTFVIILGYTKITTTLSLSLTHHTTTMIRTTGSTPTTATTTTAAAAVAATRNIIGRATTR
jgi:hypothetical protein